MCSEHNDQLCRRGPETGIPIGVFLAFCVRPPVPNALINIKPHYPLLGYGGGFDFFKKIQVPYPRGMTNSQIPHPVHFLRKKIILAGGEVAINSKIFERSIAVGQFLG